MSVSIIKDIVVPIDIVKRGHLYLADLTPRFGTEAGKTRPVVAIQTDLLNQCQHPSTWVLPCTTRLTGESILRVALPAGIAGNVRDCEVMIDQSRTIDNKRMVKELAALPTVILDEVCYKLKQLAEL